jgi:glycerophosphoryl diester phosphodiesterase
LKSPLAADRRLAARAAKVLSGYGGQAAVMSFDPAQIADLRAIAPRLTRGIAVRNHAWAEVAATPRQFIAYSIANLPALLPTVARNLFGLPLLAWTVRSTDDQRKAARYADQMIFEGFRP